MALRPRVRPALMRPKETEQMEKIKYGVTTATSGGVTKTGIFTWTGKSWCTAQLTGLVKELPASANLPKEYRAFMKSLKA
jgi:hypothetical protein